MKVVIEVDNSKLIKGDLLYFNGKDLVGYNKDAIIDDLTKRVKGLEIELAQFKEAVNDRLKENHLLLQELFKGED